jgi:amino acid transporter
MKKQQGNSWLMRLKNLIVGKSLNPSDPGTFHRLSLIAFFAWVGLGSDALSSSAYGPPEAFAVLQAHPYLAIFVGLGTALTIYIISTAYSQIIELFPAGGGGYLVASKLLSPKLGMLSGCALLIDYVMTITISVASGIEAIFSFLPPELWGYRLICSIAIILLLILLNMRGVKESVTILAPIFLLFVVSHIIMIGYAFATHALSMPQIASGIVIDTGRASQELGLMGLVFLILKSYSMGAGTYTGLEAVSNGIPILREPKVQTAKRTMQYMAISLTVMVLGLMTCYLLYNVVPQEGKTLNAVLLESVTAGWGSWGLNFIVITLVSEAALLFVAAQTGFIDGPRVLANMALDRWFPTRFATLSDRLVTYNGIMIMGGSAIAMMLISGGSVHFIMILYSITVFLTFVLSQAGMVRYWWKTRSIVKKWWEKLLINGLGMTLSLFILTSMVAVKFNEGGWITIIILSAMVFLVMTVKRHYNHTARMIKRLDDIIPLIAVKGPAAIPYVTKNDGQGTLDLKEKTAVVTVNGFNGIGIRTISEIFRTAGSEYKNFVFLEVGIVDAGVFKGSNEVANLRKKVDADLERYVKLMQQYGYYAESLSLTGIDVVEEITNEAPELKKRFPNAVFFGGQIILPKSTIPLQWLHNYTIQALQKKLGPERITFTAVSIKV